MVGSLNTSLTGTGSGNADSQNLYLSRPQVKIDGQDVSPELMKDILQISVEESLHLPAMFMLVIHNAYVPASQNAEPWRHEQEFQVGRKITIGFTSSITQDREFSTKQEGQLIEGEITAIEVNFTNKSEAHIVVRGYDVSHRLHRGRYNRSFLGMKDSDIVRKIAGELEIQIGNVEDTGIVHDYVFQENQTNMEFLRERATRNGFELFVQDNKLYCRKPKSETTLQLDWLNDISKFSVRVTTAEQVGSVEVRGWDYGKKQAIVETKNSEQLVTGTGHGKGSRASGRLKPNLAKMLVVDQPIWTTTEASKMAQALCDELGGEFVYADAAAEGDPSIRPGRIVKLRQLGEKYSGDYYITETRHFYSQRVYRTDFSVRGLREGSLLSTLSPQIHLQPGQTLMVGIVTNNKDPKGWGRVKVKYPTLTEDHESNWARVVGLGAADQRGFYCLPEVNDEVLVGFEHGDIHRPYIIGGVWNGKDQTVETVDDTIDNGKVRLRTIKTRVGHTIQCVESDKGASQKGVYITTADGHKVHLNDSDGFIEVKTKGGHTMKMSDQGGIPTIAIKSTGNIDITASGNITVKGTMIYLN
jgi:phage protein D